ncbi:Plasma membrane proteolipid 3 [Orchesella cincta]|uniref:Plasma membrane proteolipid 3 n=1 Tax=Orchesella cincta TaxID=48709 RepID=A0A1D2MPF1_ORCCI|nr:Plasma membrane proteolipid 3 [Orchesella cincta]
MEISIADVWPSFQFQPEDILPFHQSATIKRTKCQSHLLIPHLDALIDLRQSNMAASIEDILLVFICLLFPPLAALLLAGFKIDLLINVILTLLGVLPGICHAFYLMVKHTEDPYWRRLQRGKKKYKGEQNNGKIKPEEAYTKTCHIDLQIFSISQVFIANFLKTVIMWKMNTDS